MSPVYLFSCDNFTVSIIKSDRVHFGHDSAPKMLMRGVFKKCVLCLYYLLTACKLNLLCFNKQSQMRGSLALSIVAVEIRQMVMEMPLRAD